MKKYTFTSGFPDKEQKMNFKFYIRNAQNWKFLDWYQSDYFEVDIEDVRNMLYDDYEYCVSELNRADLNYLYYEIVKIFIKK